MSMDELVVLYEATRRWAAVSPTWRLRWRTRRVRRALHRDRTDERLQVRLVALEAELVRRGVLAAPTFPPRPGPVPRSPSRRSWRPWRRR